MDKIEFKYYDKKVVWEGYNNIVEINRAKKVITFIPEVVKSVLDIGCGNGIVTNMIEKPYVVGLDFAKVPLTNLKTNTIQASIDKLPIKTAKFDLIILSEVLEHLDDETYNKTINEIKSLKAKYLLITVPFKENTEIDFCKCIKCGQIFNIYHHYRSFDNTFYNDFSEYILEKNQYDSYRSPPNIKIVKLKHLFGVYSFSNNAVCNICGNPPTPPNIIFRYLFSGLTLLDNFINKILKNHKPYHQMVLLKLK